VSRYKFTIEYDGRPFVGWQRQDNGPSVQAAIEEAIRLFCGENVRVAGAGRTDAGVHAAGQVAHVDLTRDVEPDRLMAAVNHHLRPQPIAILAASAAQSDFDARLSAIRRAYRYRIVNRRAPLALDAGFAWRIPFPLDAAAMGEGAGHLVGHHDFTSFRATECQALSPMRTLDRLAVHRTGDEVVIEAEARSFLHHQIRNIAGTLAMVGAGRRPPGWVSEVLKARDRRRAGPTAPPDGLCFLWVRYPEPTPSMASVADSSVSASAKSPATNSMAATPETPSNDRNMNHS
jgi:tRNA pseudouridine38-40 synthase